MPSSYTRLLATSTNPGRPGRRLRAKAATGSRRPRLGLGLEGLWVCLGYYRVESVGPIGLTVYS